MLFSSPATGPPESFGPCAASSTPHALSYRLPKGLSRRVFRSEQRYHQCMSKMKAQATKFIKVRTEVKSLHETVESLKASGVPPRELNKKLRHLSIIEYRQELELGAVRALLLDMGRLWKLYLSQKIVVDKCKLKAHVLPFK